MVGFTNTRGNLLVYSKGYANHYDHLKAMLDRCVELGIVLKPSRSTFGLTHIKWLDRKFQSNVVNVDQVKIGKIKNAGRPTTTEKVRSLMMECQFNAKLACDNKQTTPTKMQLRHCQCCSKRTKSSNVRK